MAGFEVTVESRVPGEPPVACFTVGTDQESSWKYGTTAEEIATSVGRDYADSGSVVVRRLGGGDRFVLGRSG